MISILFYLALIIIAIGAAVIIYIARQGDCNFQLLLDKHAPFTKRELNEREAVYATTFQIVNAGTQDGTIIDIIPRPILNSDQAKQIEIQAKITMANKPREDGYWEAIIMKKYGKEKHDLLLSVKLTAKEGKLASLLPRLGEIPVDIVYEFVGRREIAVRRMRVILAPGNVA